MSKAPTGLRTVGVFMNGRACSDTLFHVLGEAFGESVQPIPPEERACQPFAGGIMQHGYQCGLIWGSALAAGAQVHRSVGAGPHAEALAVLAAQRIVDSFRLHHGTIDCVDITGLDENSSTWQLVRHFLLKGGAVDCFRMAARYAPIALASINTALAQVPAPPPPPPVSCAALLLQRLGASERQVVMAAGLAGGIGLSGGGCGALGAAIWMLGVRALEGGALKLDYRSPAALALIDRFIGHTSYELECNQIVGRKFESLADHAAHLAGGGCSGLLEVLAAAPG